MANRMAEIVELLLHEEEGSSLDFKRDQYELGNATDHQKSKLVKDILAFANAFRQVDAYILIGVEDVKGGRAKPVGIQADLDDAHLQQLINSKTNKPVTFSYQAMTIDEVKIGVIHIPLQQGPFYVTKDFGLLRKNAVYLRRGSSNDEATPDEIMLMRTSIVNRPTTHEPDLTICFDDNQTTRKVSLEPFQRKDKKEIVAALEDFKRRHPFVNPDGQPAEEQAEGDNPVRNAILSIEKELRRSMSPSITPEKAEKYNRYLKEQYRQYEEYLTEKAEYENQQMGRVDVRLKMVNGGTLPADEIEVWLHFPDGLAVIAERELIKDWKDVPFPAPKKVYFYNEVIDRLSHIPDVGSLLHYAANRGGNNPLPNVSLPKIRRTNSFEITFKVQRVRHHHSDDLKTLIVLFDNYDSASTFTIDYRITAANVPNIVTGSLTLEVEKARE